jgi:hypothetical protein
VRTIDGRSLEVQGDFDVVVVRRRPASGGEPSTLTLVHPVAATVRGDTLHLYGLDPNCVLARKRQGGVGVSDCGRAAAVPLKQISRVDLRQDHSNLWPLLGGAGGLLLGGIGGFYVAMGAEKLCGDDRSCAAGTVGAALVLGALVGCIGGAAGIDYATGGETVR